MIAGGVPALLILLIRVFVPESHKWKVQHDLGGTSHWRTKDLLGVMVGAISAIFVVGLWSPLCDGLMEVSAGHNNPSGWAYALKTARLPMTLMGLLAACVGYVYPVVKYLDRAEMAGQVRVGDRLKYTRRMLLGAGLSGVALLGTWGSLQWAPMWATSLAEQLPSTDGPTHAKEFTQISLAVGAIIGTIAAAAVGDILGRRTTYALLCAGSFVSLLYLYRANDEYGASFLISVLIAGAITGGFYGWFPLYLPELFPTYMRATGQGFAFNFGRVLSAVGTLQTAALMAYFAIGLSPNRVEIEAFPNAGATLAGIYLIGIALVWIGPETKGKSLPE